MAEKAGVKTEAVPDLDDLLQCPVCYEIPSGQIFQCNEGHHVCGRCKMRLDVCPVCRALFFGTRNYAMEELIANVRKLQAFKLGGKVTTGTGSSVNNTPVKEETSTEPDNEEEANEEGENNLNFASRSAFRTPQACKGLFRCLCCKNGNGERLPSGRLLNHLRYYHAPELIEGQSESGEYLQAWQFSTVPGRLVTAVRVADMGIFFLSIEITEDSLCAWLTMAASPWIAHEFCYTVTISGNDREAIFSDCVWSVRSCEGSLKKRGHCLIVNGSDARALIAPTAISVKLSVRRVPTDQLTQQTQPRAVLRVASRGNTRENTRGPVAQELEPFLQDLQNDVARLSRAFATLGFEANALVRSEAEMRARMDNIPRSNPTAASSNGPTTTPQVDLEPTVQNDEINTEHGSMSRNARRRMRRRLRMALNSTQSSQNARSQPTSSQRATDRGNNSQQQSEPVSNIPVHRVGYAVVQLPPTPPPSIPPQSSSGPSNGLPQNGNSTRSNKKKRRHRR